MYWSRIKNCINQLDVIGLEIFVYYMFYNPKERSDLFKNKFNISLKYFKDL